MITEEMLRNHLQRYGHKNTAIRQKLFKFLAETDAPISNSELIKSLPDTDKVSIYRTIALFEDIGVVHRIWNGFKSKIELAEAFSDHHHHFTCRYCGSTQSFDSQPVERAIKKIQTALGVRVEAHMIELSGKCRQCL